MTAPRVSSTVVALDDAADGLDDERDVVEVEVGTERPLRLCTLDQASDHRPAALANLGVAGAAMPRRDQFADTPVLKAQLEHALEKRCQAGPRIFGRGSALGDGEDLGEGVLEDGVDQLVLRGEVAVERAHA